MAKNVYRFKGTLSTTFTIDIPANNPEEALNELSKMTLDDFEDGFVDNHIDISKDLETELITGNYEITVTSVNYDITESEAAGQHTTVDKLVKSLPQRLTFNVYSDADNLDLTVTETITDITGWDVASAKYTAKEVYTK